MRIGIIINPRKSQITDPLLALDEYISRTKIPVEFMLCCYGSPYAKKQYQNLRRVEEQTLLKNSDLVVTLGGDGTILRAAHLIAERGIPILGVNLGGLGFLTETSPENFIRHFQAFLEKKYIVESRSVLTCQIENHPDIFFALNDIVIDKSGFSRVIEIITHIDGQLLNSYIADGLILSTPTGSTGYSLSAGGPIVIPQSNVILVNPICPHSLTNRPVIVPDSSVISITAFTEYKEINLYRDGEMLSSYPSGLSIVVKKADFSTNLIKMESHNFYDTIRNKLHWGEDFRNKKRWSNNNGTA